MKNILNPKGWHKEMNEGERDKDKMCDVWLLLLLIYFILLFIVVIIIISVTTMNYYIVIIISVTQQ